MEQKPKYSGFIVLPHNYHLGILIIQARHIQITKSTYLVWSASNQFRPKNIMHFEKDNMGSSVLTQMNLMYLSTWSELWPFNYGASKNYIGRISQILDPSPSHLIKKTSKELRKPQRPTALHVTTRVFKRYNDLRSTS